MSAASLFAWGQGGKLLLRSQTNAPLRVDEQHAIIRPGSLEAVEGTKTPVNQFFLRNHHSEPDLRMASWTLRIEGKVRHPLELMFSDLLEAPTIQNEVVLECAGNDAGSGVLVSSGLWEGASLASLLKQADPYSGADRVLLLGADRGRLLEGVASYPYARIMPLDQCLSGEALIAFRLNDQFLPRRHGFPARALIPGQYAMNSVKWLERIVVLGPDERPDSFYASGMDLLYVRTFYQSEPNALRRVSKILVKSRIVSPASQSRLAAGPRSISGFAWAGKDTVASVDVSTDGGKTWRSATLEGVARPFAWIRWSCPWNAQPGDHLLMSRARDSTGNWQPLERDPSRRDGYELNWTAPIACSVR